MTDAVLLTLAMLKRFGDVEALVISAIEALGDFDARGRSDFEALGYLEALGRRNVLSASVIWKRLAALATPAHRIG